jgi:hypothetical protein
LSEGGREEKGGGRMGGYPIVTIEEATVDGHGCGSSDKNDRMLVDEEEYGLKNIPFGAWRNVMWSIVSLFMLYGLRFV